MMWLSVSLLFGCWSTVHSVSMLQPITVKTDDPASLIEKWTKLEAMIQNGTESLMKTLLPKIIDIQSNVDIGPDCTESLFRLFKDLKDLRLWALHMLDATGKIEAGVLMGTLTSYGSFDQCLGLVIPSKDDQVGFTGQYCTLNMRLPVPKKPKFISLDTILPTLSEYAFKTELMEALKRSAQFFYFLAFRFGICLPSTCSEQELGDIVNYMTEDFPMNINLSGCEVRTVTVLTQTQKIVIAFLCVSPLMVIVCTFISWKLNKKIDKGSSKSLFHQLADAFSIETNTLAIIASPGPDSDQRLRCLHGIRFFSATWVVLGHAYFMLNFQQIREFNRSRAEMVKFAFQPVFNATISVDSFFFLSGVLLTYMVVQYTSKHGKTSFKPFILLVNRVWRLIPPAMIVMAITLLLNLVSSGPSWHDTVDFMERNIVERWWTIPLFINNFYNLSIAPLFHLWYIATDMQLYVLAVVYLVIYLKNSSIGRWFNLFLIAAPICLTAVLTYAMEIPPALLTNNVEPESALNVMQYSYVLPHTHLGPYAVGLALGTHLANNRKARIPKWLQIVGWISAVACNLSVLYGAYWWNNGVPYSPLEAVLYGSLHRTAWACGLAWMTYCCAHGYGGIVNRILSWQGLVPLSKLAYPVYLLHVLVILISYGSFKNNKDFNQLLIVWLFLGHLVITFAAAFVFHVLYEGPLTKMHKLVCWLITKSDKSEVFDKAELKVEVVAIRL